MKSMGAFGFFMLFLAGIALVNLRGLGERKAAVLADVTKAELITPEWRLIEFADSKVEYAGDVRLKFQDDDRVAVAGPFNRFNGQFELADSRFTVHDLAGTRRACSNEVMQAETSLLDILATTEKLSIQKQMLLLRATDGRTLARFVAAAYTEGE